MSKEEKEGVFLNLSAISPDVLWIKEAP